jgi:CRP-like cAMP-binding protein
MSPERRAQQRPRRIEPLPPDVAAHCYEAGHTQTFPRGGLLTRQGEEAARIYGIREGYARVLSCSPEGHNILVGFLGPRHLVGPSAALRYAERYVFTATACEPLQVVVWTREEALKLYTRFPALQANIETLLLHYGEILAGRLHTVSEGLVPVRLASVLLELAQCFGHTHADEPGIFVEPPVTREDLAAMTGTTVYTVSRQLRAWQNMGAVLRPRQRGYLRVDPDCLRAVVWGAG